MTPRVDDAVKNSLTHSLVSAKNENYVNGML